VAGAPALKTVVFFGLGSRPGGGGFVFQRCARETGELWLAFERAESVRCMFSFFKSRNTQ
jgi:hypothetical protein